MSNQQDISEQDPWRDNSKPSDSSSHQSPTRSTDAQYLGLSSLDTHADWNASDNKNTPQGFITPANPTLTTPHSIPSASILDMDRTSVPQKQLLDTIHKYESGQSLESVLGQHPSIVYGHDRLRQSRDFNDHDEDENDEDVLNDPIIQSLSPVGLPDAHSTLSSTSSLMVMPSTSVSVSRASSSHMLPHQDKNLTSSNPPTSSSTTPSTDTHKPSPSTLRRHMDQDRIPITSKSQTISSIQSLFTDTQKIAYVGLVYLTIQHTRTRLINHISKKPVTSFDIWSKQLMEKLYIYLDVMEEERVMIQRLGEHGVVAQDMAVGLIQDAEKARKMTETVTISRQQLDQSMLDQGYPLPDPISSTNPITNSIDTKSFMNSFDTTNTVMLNPDTTLRDTDMTQSDVRYKILTHLFILCISDGHYDARSRTLLRNISSDMEIPYTSFIHLETLISYQLRLYDDHDDVKHSESLVGHRNKVEGRNRWVWAGLATLAGGAVIGVTAGLAAPFIGAGIGAALTTFGVTGVTGLTTFMAGTGGVAIITTGGVLTGGGMSGVKMMKRTRGIEEFTFLSLEDAMKSVEENRRKRRLERLKRRKGKSGVSPGGTKIPVSGGGGASPGVPETREVLWEMGSNLGDTDTHNTPRSGKSNPDLLKDVSHDTSLNIDVTSPKPIDGIGNVDDDSPSFRPRSPTDQSKPRPTSVVITVAGWVTYGVDDYTLPFSTLTPSVTGDQYTLIWESKTLQELGSTLRILVSEIASFIFQQGLQATLLPVLMAGLTGPLWMIKLTYLVDNPWGNALTKAEKAGRVLADALMTQVQGNRPVTLIGYSLGARVIYFCLLELASHHAYGIIEHVYMFGTPVIATHRDWDRISSIVSGTIVNGYTQNDMMLGVLYRASSALWSDVAGLRPVMGVPGIVNMDLTDIVQGHMEYRSKMPRILKKCGFGVESETFVDVEDEDDGDDDVATSAVGASVSVDASGGGGDGGVSASTSTEKEAIELETKIHDVDLNRTQKDVSSPRPSDSSLPVYQPSTTQSNPPPCNTPASHSPSISSSPKPSTSWFPSLSRKQAPQSTAIPVTPSTTTTIVTSHDQIVQDELKQMTELEDMMQVYWQPREIQSTLPPLVIQKPDKKLDPSESVQPVSFTSSSVGTSGVIRDTGIPVSASSISTTSTHMATAPTSLYSPSTTTMTTASLHTPGLPVTSTVSNTSLRYGLGISSPLSTELSKPQSQSSTPNTSTLRKMNMMKSDDQLDMNILEHHLHEMGSLDTSDIHGNGNKKNIMDTGSTVISTLSNAFTGGNDMGTK